MLLIAVGIILSVVFGGWLVWRVLKRKPIKAHLVMYLLSALTGIFTIAFFMNMEDIPTIAKVLVAVVLGAVLIFWAARQQRRRQPGQP